MDNIIFYVEPEEIHEYFVKNSTRLKAEAVIVAEDTYKDIVVTLTDSDCRPYFEVYNKSSEMVFSTITSLEDIEQCFGDICGEFLLFSDEQEEHDPMDIEDRYWYAKYKTCGLISALTGHDINEVEDYLEDEVCFIVQDIAALLNDVYRIDTSYCLLP